MQQRLRKIFDALLAAFGKRNWWPGETPFEVMVGAVLTQNTSWKNVEKAIADMKNHGLMDIGRVHEVEESELADVIRSAGFFNIKAKRLKNLINVVYDQFGGSIDNCAYVETEALRSLLLGINGLGPETVDGILLYALQRPVFVVDAYTKRFLTNHGLYKDVHDYHDRQRFFQENLPKDTYLYNEFHALIVVLCQTYCKKVPACGACPLEGDRGKD